MAIWLQVSVALAFPSHDEPLRAGAAAPEDAAVIVGIEDYFALPDVPYAERDAAAFRDLLLYTVGVPSERVRLITGEASREVIDEALADAVARVGDNGTLWVYFAGHGAASPSTGERVLLGVDTLANAASFESRSVSLPAIQQVTGEVNRTVLVVDACYAGAGRDGGELLPGKRFAIPSYAAATDPKWIEWNAAQPNELSGPLEAARHGAFTWAVIGALRGWADGQLDGARDGTVTLKEAELYVEELLRDVEVTDQRPALQATERDEALVALPADKLEPRPDHAVLKVEARKPPPAAAPAPAAPVAAMPTPQAWYPGNTCTAVIAPPETRTGRYEWDAEPGIDPRATWECKPNDLFINRFPAVSGKTIEQLLVDNLASPQSRVPGKPIKVELSGSGKFPESKSSTLTDPSTWPTVPIATPRGVQDAWLVPVGRKRGTSQYAFAPVVAVEDDREPGTIWVCQVQFVSAWKLTTKICSEALATLLAPEFPEPGLVR